MKISVNTSDIKHALKNLTTVKAGCKNTLPILDNYHALYLDGTLRITSNLLETEITQTIDTLSKHGDACTFLLPRKTFEKFIKAMPKDVELTFSIENNEVTLECDGTVSVLSIKSLPIDYPSFNGLGDLLIERGSVASDKLYRVINNVAFSMAKNDVRFYLNGGLFDFNKGVLCCVTTDGHRLSLDRLSIPFEAEAKVIVPREAIIALSKLLRNNVGKLCISVSDKAMLIEIDGCLTLKTRLVDGKFPDYERVMPKQSSSIATLNREDFSKSIKKIEPFLDAKYSGVKLQVDKETLRLETTDVSDSKTSTTVRCASDIEELTIGFNAVYIKQALESSKSDKVKLMFNDADTSVLIEEVEANSSRKMVVMPMRLKKAS